MLFTILLVNSRVFSVLLVNIVNLMYFLGAFLLENLADLFLRTFVNRDVSQDLGEFSCAPDVSFYDLRAEVKYDV